MSIDLQDMDKGKGMVHFISLWGNGGADDFMIFDDISFGMEFIKFDWIGEKYLFDNKRFNPEHIDILQKWYADVEKEYAENKNFYSVKHTFKDAYDLIQERNERWKKISADYKLYADQLIDYWFTSGKHFKTGKFIQGSAYTHGLNNEERIPVISLSKTKATTRSNELVGKICGYNYKTNGEDEIALYIDRKQNKVFQKFKWT